MMKALAIGEQCWESRSVVYHWPRDPELPPMALSAGRAFQSATSGMNFSTLSQLTDRRAGETFALSFKYIQSCFFSF